MLVAIDIGNTNITIGAFEGRRLRRWSAVPTALARQPGRLRRALERAKGEAILCSVVPWATPRVERALRAAGCARVRIVGRDIRVPLINRYRYPRQVGQDRLVGAYAAWLRYHRDCIVCDFGTAITIDLVKTGHLGRRTQDAGRSPNAEYWGGVIAPGLEISLEALASRTALLPKVALKASPELLGRDTANSIRSGLLYGYAALCDGLVAALKRRYAPRAVVVATGGACALIARHARTIDYLHRHLVLEGISKLNSYS
jgi:type III pantothenate kinase